MALVKLIANKLREVELYPALLKLFRTKAHAFVEVPYQGKHVDLVFSTRQMRYLYAVEVKTINWRGAIKQAALNQLFAQLSYVALPAKVVNRFDELDRSIFHKHHVGLITVDDEATIEIPAVRNGFLHPMHHANVRTMLRTANASLIPKELGVLTDAIANRSRTLDLLQGWSNERERTVQAP
jgi:hypothetical protein